MLRELVTDVFFDLDHTLWDFDRNSALTFERILAKYEVDVDLTDFLRAYIPINSAFWKMYQEERIDQLQLRHRRLKDTFDALGYPASKELIGMLVSDYIEYLTTFNHLLPHVTEVLDYLKPGYRLHIITNGFSRVQDKKLKSSGIFHYFDQVVDSEMAGARKPSPMIFRKALTMANISPETAVMIGDSLDADIRGAMTAGMHTLHFNVNNAPVHDYCAMITDLREIKNYL